MISRIMVAVRRCAGRWQGVPSGGSRSSDLHIDGMIHLHWIEAVTDAHVHVWELDRRTQPWIDPIAMAVINRDHPVAELRGRADRCRRSYAVLSRSSTTRGRPTTSCGSAAPASSTRVVGGCDLLDPRVAERLDELVAHASGTRLAESGTRRWPSRTGRLARVRAGAGPGLRALGSAAWSVDLMLRPEHLDVAHDVVAAHPGHDLRPRPRGQGAGAQRVELRGVAHGGPR